MALTQANIGGRRHVQEVPKDPSKVDKPKGPIQSKPTHDKSALGKMMSKDLDEQFNVFMKMFITQLQNQDPTEPMDGTQMTNNLLMFFSAAEQAKTNFHLEKLNHTNETEQLVAAKSYLNKEVTYEGNELTFDGQPQPITADIPKGAQNPEIMIFDPQTNQRLKTLKLENKEGVQTVVWDGTTDANNGEQVPPGQYMIKVQAEKDENTWYDIKPRMKGMVTALDYTDDREYIYYVNNTPVRFEDISQVRKPNRDLSIHELKESLQQQISSIDNLKSLVEKRVGEENLLPSGEAIQYPDLSASGQENQGFSPQEPLVPVQQAETTGPIGTIINTITGLFR